MIETRVYDELGRDWFTREHPDLLLLYFQGTDSIGHVFAPYAPPRQPSIAQADYERYKDVAGAVLRGSSINCCAEYVALAQSTGSVIMLASDHGFLWGDGRPTTLSSAANTTAAKWHAENGIYLMWGPGIQPSQGHTGTGNVDQVCATLLALAGLPPARDIAGPALARRPRQRQLRASDYRAVYTPVTPAKGTPGDAAPSVDEDTVAKLRALGYIGATEGKGRAFGTRTAGSLNNEGLLLKQQGKQKEAIEAFDTAISVDPNLASALWNLSDLLWARGESIDKSDSLLVRAFANGLPEGTKFLIGRAIGYQRNGQIDRSIALLNQAAAAKPNEPDVWLFRGRYRVERGECAGAVDDFQQAARSDAGQRRRLCVAGARTTVRRQRNRRPSQLSEIAAARSESTEGA